MNVTSVPWFFIFFCFFTIMYQTRLRYNDRKKKKEKTIEQLLLEETLSNFSRAKPIDDSMYIKIDTSSLPFGATNSEQIIMIEQQVIKNISNPVIFTGIETNVEIKRRFGIKNLQTIIDGEENYEYLLKNLNLWASKLLEEGCKEEAETVLTAAIDAGSDISETYILLYDIYAEQKDNGKSTFLLESIDGLTGIAKQRVKKHIAEKYGN